MNHPPDPELLSAYLDGELPPTERAEVGRWLASDPAAQQLLDELRTLSGRLRSLPQRQVGVDLSQRVLEAAERQMLNPRPDVDARPVPAGNFWGTLRRRFLQPRALAWTAAILLVAAALTIFNPQPQAPRQVAQAPAPAAPPAAGAARAEFDRLAQAERRLSEASREAASDEKSEARLQPTMRATARPAENAAMGLAKKAAGKEEPTALGDLAKDKDVGGRGGERSGKAVAPLALKRAGRELGVSRSKTAVADDTSREVLKSDAGPVGRVAGASGGPAPAMMASPPPLPSRQMPAAAAPAKDGEAAPPQGNLLIVECFVGSEALHRQMLEQVLVHNGVELRPVAAGRAPVAAGRASSDNAVNLTMQNASPAAALSTRYDLRDRSKIVRMYDAHMTPVQLQTSLLQLSNQRQITLQPPFAVENFTVTEEERQEPESQRRAGVGYGGAHARPRKAEEAAAPAPTTAAAATAPAAQDGPAPGLSGAANLSLDDRGQQAAGKPTAAQYNVRFVVRLAGGGAAPIQRAKAAPPNPVPPAAAVPATVVPAERPARAGDVK